jgi:hypothetical protein
MEKSMLSLDNMVKSVFPPGNMEKAKNLASFVKRSSKRSFLEET